MSIQPTASTSGAKHRQAFPGLEANQLRPEDFLTLLVAELQNQDPLEPTSPREMIDQLAQLQSLLQLQQISALLEKTSAHPPELWQSLGRTVRWIDDSGQTKEGHVEAIVRQGEEWFMQVGDTMVSWEQVIALTQ